MPSIKFAATKAAALLFTVALTGFPALASATCAWTVVPSVNGTASGNEAVAISADSSSDAWSVGYYFNASGVPAALAQRWNGSKWAAVGIHNGSNYGSVLDTVSAYSPTVAFTGGYYNNGKINVPLLEKWNGSTWTITPSPSVGTYGGDILGIVALSATNAWAVGLVYTSNAQYPTTKTLIEHWNGTAWSIFPSPNVNTIENTWGSITAISPTDIWAGGIYSKSQVGYHSTLAAHFNGSTWTLSYPRSPTSTSSNINAISAVSTNFVYASGDYYDGTNTMQFRTLPQYWNGKAWVGQATTDESTFQTDIGGLAAVSTTEVMHVGHYVNAAGQNIQFAMLWNGTHMLNTVLPTLSSPGSFLNGASTIPKTLDIWASGSTVDASNNLVQTLIERYHCT